MSKKALIISLSVLLIGGLSMWWMFGGGDKHLQLIPKNAVVVVKVDWKSLAEKATFEKIKELNFYKKFDGEMQMGDSEMATKVREMLANPLSSGIDLGADLYFFGAPTENVFYTGMAFGISDADDFASTVRIFDKNAQIISAANCQMMRLSGQTLLAWSEKGGVFIATDSYRLEDDWEMKYAQWLFGQKKDETMADHDKFKSMMKGSKDITFFMDGTSTLNYARTEMRGFEKELLENMNYLDNTWVLATLEFAKDEVVLSSTIESNNPNYEAMKGMYRDGVSDQTLAMIGDEKTIGAAAVSLDMPKFMDYLGSLPTVRKNMDEALSGMGITLDELKNSFTGDFSIALNDFKMTTPEPMPTPEQIAAMPMEEQWQYYYYTPREPAPYATWSLQLPMSNKGLMQKILEKAGMTSRNGKGEYVLDSSWGDEPDLILAEIPSGYMISNDTLLIEKARSGSVGQLPEQIKSALSGRAMGGYYNLDYNAYPESIRNVVSKQFGPFSAEQLKNGATKDFVFEVNKDGNSEMTLHLIPSDENSLFDIIKYIDGWYNALSSSSRSRYDGYEGYPDAVQEAPAEELIMAE